MLVALTQFYHRKSDAVIYSEPATECKPQLFSTIQSNFFVELLFPKTIYPSFESKAKSKSKIYQPHHFRTEWP